MSARAKVEAHHELTETRAQAHGFSCGSSERMQKQHYDTPGW
jgi:hypothetical protein